MSWVHACRDFLISITANRRYRRVVRYTIRSTVVLAFRGLWYTVPQSTYSLPINHLKGGFAMQNNNHIGAICLAIVAFVTGAIFFSNADSEEQEYPEAYATLTSCEPNCAATSHTKTKSSAISQTEPRRTAVRKCSCRFERQHWRRCLGRLGTPPPVLVWR